MRTGRRLTAIFGASALAFAGVTMLVAPTAGAQTVTATFAHTGAAQTFPVPAGVTEVTIEAFGAQGGAGSGTVPTAGTAQSFALGGQGGRARTTIAVTPGEVLQVNVGGAGGDATDTVPGLPGFNGGRTGGSVGAGPLCTARGGGSGGASDVRRGANALADRVVVGAGGGATGVAAFDDGDAGVDGAAGGDGGGAIGEDGGGGPRGTGGTQVAGGTNNGVAGVGGAGNNNIVSIPDNATCTTGGPGGGGWFGGGGGNAGNRDNVGGGGGGSSFPPSDTSTGVRSGNGLVTISFVLPPVDVVTSCGTVVLDSSQGELADVAFTPLPETPEPPDDLEFPCGLLGFQVTGLTAGQTVTITLVVPTEVDEYWKLQNGEYTQLTDATFAGDTVTFELTDGGTGDADGVANGTIVDPGGPALVQIDPPPPSVAPVVVTPTFAG